MGFRFRLGPVSVGSGGARVKAGPVSVSSRGRVGISAGPVSVSGGPGGGRRRSSKRERSEDFGADGPLVESATVHVRFSPRPVEQPQDDRWLRSLTDPERMLRAEEVATKYLRSPQERLEDLPPGADLYAAPFGSARQRCRYQQGMDDYCFTHLRVH